MNIISHWLDANLESVLYTVMCFQQASLDNEGFPCSAGWSFPKLKRAMKTLTNIIYYSKLTIAFHSMACLSLWNLGDLTPDVVEKLPIWS